MRSSFNRVARGAAIAAAAIGSVLAPVWLLAIQPSDAAGPAHVAADSSPGVVRAAAPPVARPRAAPRSTVSVSGSGAVTLTRLPARPPVAHKPTRRTRPTTRPARTVHVIRPLPVRPSSAPPSAPPVTTAEAPASPPTETTTTTSTTTPAPDAPAQAVAVTKKKTNAKGEKKAAPAKSRAPVKPVTRATATRPTALDPTSPRGDVTGGAEPGKGGDAKDASEQADSDSKNAATAATAASASTGSDSSRSSGDASGSQGSADSQGNGNGHGNDGGHDNGHGNGNGHGGR